MVPTRREDARLVIERVVAGGDGLARQDGGRVVFVPGALPDEVVEVALVAAQRDFARGVLHHVVTPSPHRIAAPCPELARGCGGCDWQHIDAVAQLQFKADIVREALRRTAKMPDATVTVGGSVPPWAYRTSMRFALDGQQRPALRMARSNDTVDVPRCMIAHPLLVDLVRTVRLSAAESPDRDGSEGGVEVSLRVSAATGERSAWWTPTDARVVQMPADVAVGEHATVTEHIAGVHLRVSTASFFQSGPDAANLLVDTVRALVADELRSARTVVDLYGGVGLFAACVVPAGACVVLVEGSPSACADARHNLSQRNADVMESAVEDWSPVRAEVVIADPSRRGLGAQAIERIVATRAATLVLVSCDPVAFARDAALLASDYRLVRSIALDLFPQTHHVEVVSRFDRLAE